MLSNTMKRKLTRLFHFQDFDKDGYVEREDWEKCARALAEARGWPEGTAPYNSLMKRHVRVWQNFWAPADEDGDGKVTLEEYLQLVAEQQAQGGVSMKLVNELFNVIGEAIDRDGDGNITLDDYRVFFKSWGLDENEAVTAFPHLDSNNDGLVSRMMFMQFGINYFYLDQEGARENWLFGPLPPANKAAQKQTTLSAARTALLTQIRAVGGDQWDTSVYVEGEEWSISDVLRHLMGAESSMARLIENIRDGGEGASPDFDLDRFNRSRIKKAKDKSIPQLLVGLEESRAYVLEVVNGLAEADWAKEGRHGSLRMMSIEEIVDLIAGHEKQHAADIGRALYAANQPAGNQAAGNPANDEEE